MAETPVSPPMVLCNGASDLGPLFSTPSVEIPCPLFTSNNGSKFKQARLLFPPAKSPPPMCAEKSHQATSLPNHIEEAKNSQDTSAENSSHESPMDTSGPNIDDVVPETEGDPLSLPADEKMDTWEVAGSDEGNGGSLQDETEPCTLDCKEGGSKATGNTTKAQKAKPSKQTRGGALKAERERVKEEARAKREAEKQRKEQEKRERREKREQEERERRERREQEEQEKKERKEKREEEKKKKEDERNQKLEAKRKKDEEKRQLEEQAKEEKLQKEQMKKSKFLGFFSKLPKESPSKKENSSNQDSAVFTPFSTQPGMALAKPPRSPVKDKTQFDTTLENQDFSSVYIQECKSKKLRPDSRSKPKPTSPSQVVLVPDTDEDDVIIMSSSQPPTQAARSVKFKLLQFHENHRPAYYGTVCRRSQLISPRNPFRKDKHLLDYEVDSDDEWEEEEPGESISESEGEEEPGEDSDEDDGFFVPHGYLSEDEGDNSDREAGEEESRKQKQLVKAKAWEAEFARKCQPLKAVKVGCVWHRMGVEQPSRDELFLQQFAAMALVELPVRIESTPDTQVSSSSGNGNADSTRRPVPEEAMPDLIRLVHESSMGLGRLIKTFRTHWGAKVTAEQEKSKADNPLTFPAQPTEVSKTPETPQSRPDYERASGISKRQLEMKITKIAAKEQRATSCKPLWYVQDSVFQQYGIEASTITPLVPLASPFAKPQPCDREKIKVSPETPCSGITKKGTKRRVDGTPSVKSLFEVLAKSPKVDAEQPKEKKLRLSPNADKSGSVDPVHSGTAQSLLTQFDSQMSPRKPHPLPTSSDQHRPSGQEVIVILTDDSSNDSRESPLSKKENVVTEAGSGCTTRSILPLPTAAALCNTAKPPLCSEALQECTNQPPRQGAATVQLPEHRIDWQKLMASSNEVVTSADVH